MDKKMVEQEISVLKISMDNAIKNCLFEDDARVYIQIRYEEGNGYVVSLETNKDKTTFNANCGKNVTFANVMDALGFNQNINNAMSNAEKTTDKLIKNGALNPIAISLYSRPTFDTMGLVAKIHIPNNPPFIAYENQINKEKEKHVNLGIDNIKMFARDEINNTICSNIKMAEAITGVNLKGYIECTLPPNHPALQR